MNTPNRTLSTQGEPTTKTTLRAGPPAPVAVRWLLGIALVYTLYFARSLLVPVLVALLLALLTSPLVALLKRLHIPRTLSALLILCAIGGPLSLLTIELAAPAQKWAVRLPELSAFMSEKLNALSPEPPPVAVVVAPAKPEPEPEKGFNFWGIFSSDDPEPVPVAPVPEPLPVEKTGGEVVSEKIMESGMEAALSMVVATPVVIAQVLTCLILFLFLLIFGPKLFEVAVLNFAPYIGPLLVIGILCMAGVAQYGLEAAAIMPVLVYLVLNLLEAQLVTPMMLGRNMRLNPLVVMLWLVIWGWLWGASGVLLAVPMLVCIKLVAEPLRIASGWIRVLESKV